MLDNGFSLHRFEVNNWGNFQGYQKFNLRGISDGGIFAEPSASAILGVNGSGKSTLIDGFMIVMLPFEKSVKLGVTNDVESGNAGGRSIKDYVLGKYASMGGSADFDHDQVYSRKTGTSIVLLNFKHNADSSKNITLGRVWWYKNGKLHETSISFICHRDISIESLCVNGIFPNSPRAFKEEVEKKQKSFEFFETAEAYFNSLSVCFGGIKREDLKLLNRAFYVKSISNIDQFIRENMLIESESPHLDILLQNVKSGKEISETIRICEEKMATIEKVIKPLEKLVVISQEQIRLSEQKDMLSLFHDWKEIQSMQVEKDEIEIRLQESYLRLPELKLTFETLTRKKIETQTLLAQNSSFLQVEMLRREIADLEHRLSRLQILSAEAEKVLDILKIKGPKKNQDVGTFLAKIEQNKSEFEEKKKSGEDVLLEIRNAKEGIRRTSEESRQELNHLQKNRTLIPANIYSIKEKAISELKLSDKQLLFVGELIQVPEKEGEYRRAIESVLEPVAKNLLCHPDVLERFTKWLNEQNLSSTLVVKRIAAAEFQGNRTPKDIQKDSILAKIEVLDESQNPFCHYMWNWLLDVFDYQIVSLAEFKKNTAKVVTVEGLVKSDVRTMRKLRQDLKYSLGWNPQERIDEIVRSLEKLHNEDRQLDRELESHRTVMASLDLQLRSFDFFSRESVFEYLQIPLVKDTLAALKTREQELVSNDIKLASLRVEAESLEKQVLSAQQGVLEEDSRIKLWEQRKLFISSVLPDKINELNSTAILNRLRTRHGDGASYLNTYLDSIEKKIQKGAKLNFIIEDLDKALTNLDGGRGPLISRATAGLMTYQNDYFDPNLSYTLPGDLSKVEDFLKDWREAYERLVSTELVQAKERFRDFFDRILIESVKTTINEFKTQIIDIQRNIASINEVLKLTNYEDLLDEKRYLQIVFGSSVDDRVIRFKRKLKGMEELLAPALRSQAEEASKEVMASLMSFVEDLQKDSNDRYFVTDVRNHFYYHVHSFRRAGEHFNDVADIKVEEFTGARKDAKSSAQTTQLAYALLASALAYRFKFNDRIAGANTLRCLILDEFGGKFDNEKPKDIVMLLEKMGFQSLLVSPMSKADLLADRMSHLVMVHKVSAKESKVCSYSVVTRDEYERVLQTLSAGV